VCKVCDYRQLNSESLTLVIDATTIESVERPR